MTLKIQITEEMLSSEQFSFTSKCKDLEAALSRCAATLSTSPSGARNFSILATKSGRVFVAGIGSDTLIVLKVQNAKATNAGIFGAEIDKLLGIIKGRSDLVFTFTTNRECEFKAIKGKYSGKILTLPITQETANLFNTTFSSKAKADSTATFSTKVLEIVKEGLNAVAVRDVFNQTSLLSYLSFRHKSISISTFDNHHFGLYEADSDYVGEPFSIASPITHFQLVEKLVNSYLDSTEQVTFSTQKETLRVDSDSFLVVLPLMQADEKNFNLISNFINEVGKPDIEFGLNIESLAKIIDNLFTLQGVNTSFNFYVKDKIDQLKVTFTSPSGSASDQLKITLIKSKTIVAKADPKIFNDLIGLARQLKDVSITINTNKCIILKAVTKLGSSVTLVCSLV